jgi:hypothetical protein
VQADPGEVVPAEGRPGDDAEAVLGESGDGEIALDPPTLVEHLRVGDRTHVTRDLVVTHSLEELGGLRPDDLDLRERGLVEQRRSRTAGDMLGSDRR